jgi:hypothetical protein
MGQCSRMSHDRSAPRILLDEMYESAEGHLGRLVGRNLDRLVWAALGGVAGGMLGETIVGWLSRSCTTVAVVYQGCQANSPALPARFIIDAVAVLGGTALVSAIYNLLRLP